MQLLFRKEKDGQHYNVYMSDAQGTKCHTRIQSQLLTDPDFNVVLFLMGLFEEMKAITNPV